MPKKSTLGWIGLCSVVALLVGLELWSNFGGKGGTDKAVELTAAQKYEVEAARQRISTCRAFVRSAGNYHPAVSEVERADKALNDYIANPEKESIGWVDHNLSSAYDMARRPQVVADLHQQAEELTSYMLDVLERPAQHGRAYKHLDQARIYIKLYAAGASQALPVVIREELSFARQLADKGKPVTGNRMVAMFERLLDAEEKAESASKEQFRLVCHAKQARRYFDAACRSMRHRTNWRLQNLVEAECAYVAKLAAEPAYVVEPGDKDEVPAWLKLVDDLAAQITLAEKELSGNEEVLEALKKVRSGFDYGVQRMSEGHSGFHDDVWVRQSLHDSSRVIERLIAQKGMHQVKESDDVEFKTWLDGYLTQNADSWIKGRQVEFWLVPQKLVGNPDSVQMIGNREHCYLKTSYKGRSVLAVVPK